MSDGKNITKRCFKREKKNATVKYTYKVVV